MFPVAAAHNHFHLHQIIIYVFLSLLPLLSSAKNTSSTQCGQSCGNHSVPYPFGFSNGCGIQLNCCSTSGKIKIGDFLVQNVTSDQILISVPANCSRSIEELSVLFSQNFAPTSRNGLLFERCKSPLRDCAIPDRLSSSRFLFEACDTRERNESRYNTSCYVNGLADGRELLNNETVKNKGNCSVLFSSIMVDLNGSSSVFSGGPFVLLEFQAMELGWWIHGACNCDPKATCVHVPVRYGKPLGFRCNCRQGFEGDGFANGKGCRKVSESSTAPRDKPVPWCRTRLGILITGVIAGISIATFLAFICCCIQRSSKSLKKKFKGRHLLSEAAGNSNVPFYPYKELERATNGFADKLRLGTGAYGTVYAGKLHNDELVAIKKIRYQDHDSVERVMNEIKLLSSVSHPNLVRLLGCCIEKGEQVLVYEYMPNGTLSQHLQRQRGSVLPWTIRLTIAAETAHAIAHLHSAMNPPIYHRDIKSSNILLDYNFGSKVADFGLSRFGMLDDSHISTAPQGTPGYVDPQYHQNFHLSDKSDVYSFGVVLVEIITAMKVVDFSRHHSEINLAALAVDRISKGLVDDIIDPFIEPNRDAWTLSSVHKVAELAFRCLAFHRDMRPSMMEVADELEQIRLSGWAPLEENICMGSPMASSCSSSYLGSEKSMDTSTAAKKVGMASSCSSPYLGSEKSMDTSTAAKKVGVGSTTLIFMQGTGNHRGLTVKEEATNSSPVSVQDPWLSEQSTLSSNSLLGKVV
ncbi:Serine/threonine protein kinase [Handroanthus impetiginosus]|uniref:Serine/threonine protein kinase n=1 Tax=Handroanthus impetiginosus TaxID=429701 RepID=A0A2G9GB58_9LAMI|nr:Serine/threonine protein kinase [Handroanthus impetiginosus]